MATQVPVKLAPPYGLRSQPKSAYIPPDEPEISDEWDDHADGEEYPILHGMDKNRQAQAMARPDHHRTGGVKRRSNTIAGRIRAYLKKNGPSYYCEINKGVRVPSESLSGNLSSLKKWKHVKTEKGQYGVLIYRLPDQEHVYKNNPTIKVTRTA